MNVKAELESLQRLEDRILSTSNEGLSKVLDILLPKLIALINKDELRSRVMKMFGSLLKRLKDLSECELPLKKLIALVRREHMPYACNFTMTFIDVVWDRQSNKNVDLAVQLLLSILDWPVHSPQSNALLWYTLNILPLLPEAMDAYKALCIQEQLEDNSGVLKDILGDYFLDVSLLHGTNPIRKGAAGSVQVSLE